MANPLSPSTPADNGFIGDGAAEIRAIKQWATNVFPAVDGATAISKPTGYGTAATTEPATSDYTKLFTDVHSLVNPDPGAENPILVRGMIMSWFGDPQNATLIADLNAKGWYLCTGGTANGITIPDLTDRFIEGHFGADWGSTANGAADLTVNARTGSPLIPGSDTAKSVTKTVDVSLTEANIPEHRHFIAVNNYGETPRPTAEITSSNPLGVRGSDNNPQYELATTTVSATPNVGPTSKYGNPSVTPININAGLSVSEFDHEHEVDITGSIIPPSMKLAYIIYVGT